MLRCFDVQRPSAGPGLSHFTPPSRFPTALLARLYPLRRSLCAKQKCGSKYGVDRSCFFLVPFLWVCCRRASSLPSGRPVNRPQPIDPDMESPNLNSVHLYLSTPAFLVNFIIDIQLHLIVSVPTKILILPAIHFISSTNSPLTPTRKHHHTHLQNGSSPN